MIIIYLLGKKTFIILMKLINILIKELITLEVVNLFFQKIKIKIFKLKISQIYHIIPHLN